MTDEAVASSRVGSSRRMRLFLKASVFDYLLVLIVSAGLVYTVSYGFNSAPDLRQNAVVTVVLCAILLVPLYAGAWSKRAAALAAVAYVAVAAVVVVAMSSLSGAASPLFVDGQINDVEENYTIYGLVMVIVPLIAFLLGRKPWGVVCLLLVSALCCGTIQFLYRDWVSDQPGTVVALVVYGAIAALMVVQGYRAGVLRAERAAKTAFGWSFAYGIAMAVVCVLAAVALFFGVIANLGISTLNIKPFQDYYQVPIVEYDGTYIQQEVIDPDQATSTLSDDEEDTIDDAQGAESDEENEQESGGQTLTETIIDALNLDDWSNVFDANRFDLPPSLRFLLALVPLAVIAAVVYSRYRARFRRLARFEQRGPNERAVLFYDYFMRSFKRLGVSRAASLTPLEFAIATHAELARFEDNPSHADFLDMTLVYQRASYGAGNVDAADCKLLRDYYLSFFKNAHERMGSVKWALWGYWRI